LINLKLQKMINDILLSANKAKGKRPYFLENPEVERVLNITMAVAMEVGVMHERLDTIERLLEKKGILSKIEIEAFEPNNEEVIERQLWHARYIARVLRIVQQELEALQQDPEYNLSMEEIAERLRHS
jgi:pantoate kinase